MSNYDSHAWQWMTHNPVLYLAISFVLTKLSTLSAGTSTLSLLSACGRTVLAAAEAATVTAAVDVEVVIADVHVWL